MANRDVGRRVAEHRMRLREQGLRPLQIWVPDTRAPEFAEEAHRQSALAAAGRNAGDDQDFVDAISQFNDEDCRPRPGWPGSQIEGPAAALTAPAGRIGYLDHRCGGSSRARASSINSNWCSGSVGEDSNRLRPCRAKTSGRLVIAGAAAVRGCAKPGQPYGSRIRHEDRKKPFATLSGNSAIPQLSPLTFAS